MVSASNTKGDNDLLLPVSEMVSQLKLPRNQEMVRVTTRKCSDNQKIACQQENIIESRK